VRGHAGQTLIIAMRDPGSTSPRLAMKAPVIPGRKNGMLDLGGMAAGLHEAIETLSTGRPIREEPAARPAAPGPRDPARSPEIIVVAASTGGPGALITLLRHIEPPRVPVVVAQHMPADQTMAFARHLAVETGLTVSETGAGQLPAAQIVVLRGGADYRIRRAASSGFWLSTTSIAGSAFHPSADLLLGSAVDAGIRVAAVVLSGMGEDGARGAAMVAAHGGGVLIQDFKSCVVAGMPQAARAACQSALVASLPRIAEKLSSWTAPFHGLVPAEES